MNTDKSTSSLELDEVLERGVVTRFRKRYGKSENSSNGDRSPNDKLVLEEPLEILMNGELISITMRTPGHDDVLAVGFLFSEGMIQSAGDINKLEDNCKSDDGCNTMNVYLPMKDGNENSDKAENMVPVLPSALGDLPENYQQGRGVPSWPDAWNDDPQAQDDTAFGL